MPGDIGWWREARFGLFLHWGLYALPARNEWARGAEEMAPEAYRRYFERFEPDLFDPADWARRARDAGMKYVVLTAKHLEGFCLWDTATTDFKATNTPAGRDLLAAILAAFRAEGFRIGIYYQIADWEHPDYKLDYLHPLRGDAAAQAAAGGRDMRRYARHMRRQLEELLGRYGRIDLLWFDHAYPPDRMGTTPEEWEAEELLALARRLQPGILVNDRLMLPGAADFRCPEQYVPAAGVRDASGRPLDWEGCQTLAGSWGYCRDEAGWKAPEQLLALLIRQVARGGNLLLNVGPTGRGRFDGRATAALRVYAEWMSFHARAIHGCTAAPEWLTEPPGCSFTWNGPRRRLYIHCHEWPTGTLAVRRLADRIRYAQLLHDASEIVHRRGCRNEAGHVGRDSLPEDAVVFQLPALKPPVVVPVIEVFLQE